MSGVDLQKEVDAGRQAADANLSPVELELQAMLTKAVAFAVAHKLPIVAMFPYGKKGLFALAAGDAGRCLALLKRTAVRIVDMEMRRRSGADLETSERIVEVPYVNH